MHLEEINHKVIRLVRKVGAFITAEAAGFDRSVVEIKALNSLVSYVDKEAEKRLVDGLQSIVPEAGFIAEEGTGTPNKDGFNWILDPLDGTTNFIHGLPIYAISIALVKDGELLSGVVYEPNSKECFHAIKGKGTYCNGVKLGVSPVTQISEALLATGFPYYDFEKMPEYTEVLKTFMQCSHGLRRMGSAAIDLAYVAAGRFEGFFEYNLSPWDVAAGALLVKEAGGYVTDFDGKDNFIFGKEILAAGPIHKEMLERIKKRFR